MVSVSTLVAVVITVLITFILPFIIYIIYGSKNKGKGVWSAWLLGSSGFFVVQILIRIPLLNILSTKTEFITFAENHYLLYIFLLAFTAGLFEVIARYAVAKIMRKNLTYKRGIAAGLGHGGIESILIVGVTYVTNLFYILAINTGSYEVMIEEYTKQGLDVSTLATLKDTFINTNSSIFYLAGYERLLTMIFHVALSLLVCYLVSRKKDVLAIVLGLFIHCFIDFVAAFLNSLSTNYLGNVLSITTAYIITYSVLTIVAVVSIFVIRWIKKQWVASQE